MTKKQKERNREIAQWYAAERMNLIERLGGKCANPDCPGDDRMEIDHPNGRDWQPRNHGKLTRMRRYLEEEKKGLLRVLCRSCNGHDGAMRRWRARGAA